MTARRRRGILSGLALAGAGIVAALGPVSAPAFPGVPPTASITASPNPALVDENVNFDGSGSTGDGLGGSITTYEWDLDGDNTFETSTGTNPTVSRPYSTPATITVSLRVTEDDGDTDEDSVSLVVNSPPTAAFIYEPSTPAVNEQITFSSTATDAEGPIPNSSQRWDFDNDGQFDEATGQTVTRAYSNPGTKPVGLRVTDSDGASATVVRNVVVQSNPPSAAFSFAPQSPLSGETVLFDGSGSIAPAGQTITAMTWDLDDDGAFDDRSWPHAQASYSTPGPHTVRLRVDASGGGFDIARQVVPVGNRPPTASFEFSPRPARAGEKLGLASTSSDPDSPIVDTAWDLDGDGEFDDASGPTAQLRAPKHGTLTVGLKVVDSGGVSDQVTDSVPLRGRPRKLLAPFPVVRLAGELKQNGNTEIDRLSVRAPKGSDVTVGCHGRSCPFRSRTRAVKKHRVGFPGLERVLRPGVVIRVYVTDSAQGRKVHQLQAPGREGPKAHRQVPEGRAPQADSMPLVTRAARDRSNRWQLPLLIVLVLGAFGGFFAVGHAGSEGTSVEASGERSEAGTDHQLSLPNVRLTGSGNLPQLAAVSEPPSAEKPKPTPPPAAQTTAPAEPAVRRPRPGGSASRPRHPRARARAHADPGAVLLVRAVGRLESASCHLRRLWLSTASATPHLGR